MRYFILIVLSIFLIPLSSVKPGIFLGAFSQMKASDLWYVQYVIMTTLLFIGLSLRIMKYNFLLGIFTLLCLFSAIFVTYQAPRSMFVAIQIYLSVLAIIYISKIDFKKREFLLKCITIMAVIQCLWTIVQFFQLDPFFRYVGSLDITEITPGVKINDSVGLSGSRNQLGLYLSNTLPLILNYSVWFLPFSLFALFCSTTSASIIGGFSACIFYVSFLKRKFLPLLLIVFILAGLCFYTKFETINDIIINERITLWKATIQAVKDGKLYMNVNNLNQTVYCNSWFGFGLGSFIIYSPMSQMYMVYNHFYEHAHNDYLEILFDMGYIGFFVVILILADLLFKFIKAKKTKFLVLVSACLLSHFINALNIYTVQTAVSGSLLILFLGLFYGEIRRQNGKSPEMA